MGSISIDRSHVNSPRLLNAIKKAYNCFMIVRRFFFALIFMAGLLAFSNVATAIPVVDLLDDASLTRRAMVERPEAMSSQTPIYGYRVLAEYPHDANAFTQGLVYAGGELYESTGLRQGRSSVRRVELETGAILQMRTLADTYFGEGLTLFQGRLYQLTWQSHTGFIYDSTTFDLLNVFHYSTEGWGLTHNGKELIMSDGTPTLYFLDPISLQPIRQITVKDEKGPVWRLNELEFIDGEIYANVWQTDRIARIDPTTGRVNAWIDLTGLLSPDDRIGADVLNGIAWDAEQQRLFVTGKLWPKLFQIELAPLEHRLYLSRVLFESPIIPYQTRSF